MLPEASIIIPSYSSRSTIEKTLDSIYAQVATFAYQVVVVDSSPDDTAQWLAKRNPDLQVIHSVDRLLPGQARNLGLRETQSEYVAFLDADAEATPNWLANCVSRLAGTEAPSAVGGWIANANPQRKASRVLHWIEFSEFLPGTKSGPRAYLSSSNLVLRRRTIEKAGGFPSELAMCEDLALCTRLEGRAWFEGTCGILHTHRQEWRLVLEHLDLLGYWSGRFRTMAAVSGSWLRSRPGLTRLLPWWRLPRIWVRAFRESPRKGMEAILASVSLMRGLRAWSQGFERGLRES